MRVRDLVTLYDYHYAATKKILAQAERVTLEQWAGPPPLGDRSLREILVHTLDVERVWRSDWLGQSEFTPLDSAAFPDAAPLAARWREEEEAMRAYLDSLSDDDLQRDYQDVDAARPCRLWEIVTHVTYHGMQHRSEAAMLLTHFGHSPRSIDMVFWLDERD